MKKTIFPTFTSSRFILPILVVSFLFIPWLGEPLFYSKGEPREAIVAMSMIDSGDWILPVTYGEDIPYKPPFMAWLIAILALLFNGGEVTEYISRLPSAIAAVALLVATWRFVSSNISQRDGWRAMLILATMFEFFRAAVACRVDMLLTACMVGGIFALYNSLSNPRRILWAILLFSGATLTKGPIGTLLPCLALGIFYLLQKHNFFKVFIKLTLIASASLIIPAVWYWLAYRQGGEVFGQLAWEENIGRLTGSMSYDSHVNPWYYNFISLLAGTLPWTVPVLLTLCYRHMRSKFKQFISRGKFHLFCVIIPLVILTFYCLPESKRSVYLLPCYPFLAIGCSYVLNSVAESRLARIWANFLAILAIIAPVAWICIMNVGIDKLPVQNPGLFNSIISFIPVPVALWWLLTRSSRADGLAGAIVLTYMIMLTYNAAYMPSFVNPKSDKYVAEKIKEIVPGDAKLESYIEEDRLLRYYSLNFYLKDRLRRAHPDSQDYHDRWIITGTPTDTTEALLLTTRSADTRKPIFLLKPVDL